VRPTGAGAGVSPAAPEAAGSPAGPDFPTRRARGRRWLAGACALALIAAGAAAALAAAPGPGGTVEPEAVRSVVAPYLAARARGAVGAVAGGASEDSRSPTTAAQPVAGVSVMLLPRSPDFDTRLDELKASARDSMWAYAESGERLGDLRADYERALAMAGGGELVRGEVTDAEGRFRFGEVPVGRWVLIAWHETPHLHGGRKVKKTDAGTFRGSVERMGYVAVTYWRLEVEVRPGEPATVSLNDRNGWFTAVRELNRQPIDAQPPEPRRRR
jgi:hypothetical protein